jgi:type I restriction enzyme M protein
MNLYLNGVEDFSIACADTLSAPAFTEGSKLKTFDVVLANPPYSIKEWNRAAFEHDKWGRNFLGTPPEGRADYAFIQHIIKSMDEKHGKCAILLPHGILFRKEEQEMRRKLVESNKIECIVGLGPNLFYNSPMEACVLICNNHKRDELFNKILYINAVDEVTRKNGESFLEDKHIKAIKDSYFKLLNKEKFSRIVPYKEIEGNDFDLSIQKYIFRNQVISEGIRTFDEEYVDWDRDQKQLNKNLEAFIALLS